MSKATNRKRKGVKGRISRVVEMLKTADRRSVPNGFASYVDSRIVDKAIAILEGKEEQEVESPTTRFANYWKIRGEGKVEGD